MALFYFHLIKGATFGSFTENEVQIFLCLVLVLFPVAFLILCRVSPLFGVWLLENDLVSWPATKMKIFFKMNRCLFYCTDPSQIALLVDHSNISC